MGNLIYTIILFILFIGIIFYVFGSKRKKQYELDATIPFDNPDEIKKDEENK